MDAFCGDDENHNLRSPSVIKSSGVYTPSVHCREVFTTLKPTHKFIFKLEFLTIFLHFSIDVLIKNLKVAMMTNHNPSSRRGACVVDLKSCSTHVYFLSNFYFNCVIENTTGCCSFLDCFRRRWRLKLPSLEFRLARIYEV